MDEYSWEVQDGVQDDVAKLMVDCMVEAGKYLKLPLELAGEAKISFEGSWRDVH